MKVIVPDFDHALVFLMTVPSFSFHFQSWNKVMKYYQWIVQVDNTGPQNPTMVQEGWVNTQKMFPNARLFASSLDVFMEQLWPRNIHFYTKIIFFFICLVHHFSKNWQTFVVWGTLR
jgi:hypothetical protein